MSDLKICRICLVTKIKMFQLENYHIKPLYESIMSSMIPVNDNLPPFVCYECAALLYKYHKFKEKCHTGQIVLEELLWNESITYESIEKINRKQKCLTSTLTKVILDSIDSCASQDIEVKQENDNDVIDNDAIDNDAIDNDDSDNRNDDYDNLYFNDDDDNIPIHNFISDNINRVCLEVSPCIEVKKEEKLLIESEIDIQRSSTKRHKLRSKIKTRTKTKTRKVHKSKPNQNLRRTNRQTDKIDKRKAKTVYLNTEHWRIQTLNEEEAIEEFRAKSSDPKYQKAAYKCLDCFKGFSDDDIFNRHIQFRHTDAGGKFPCSFCKIRFWSNGKRTYHMPEHYTKYHCLRCNFKCNSKPSARFHDAAHNGVIRKCKYCDEEFRHSSSYYTHIRVVHRSEFVCPTCGASFVSRLGLNMHNKRTHFDKVQKSKEEKSLSEPSIDAMGTKTYCDRCDMRFDTCAAYEQHLLHSAKHEDDFEKTKKPRDMRWKGNRVRKRGPLKKPTTCNHCGKHFDTQKACMKHHLSEHPRKPFHAPNERIICEICGASLSPNSIHAHVNAHLKTKLYACDTCGRQFHSSAVLKRHLLTHTGEKPYPCSLCDKRFTQSNSMKLHYRTFHLKEPYPKRDRRRKKMDQNIDHEGALSEDSEEVTSLATRGQHRLQYFNTHPM